MIRRLPLLALLTLMALAAPAPPAAAQSLEAAGPSLKPTASVVGDIVRIGDLVENAGVVAEVPIFRAPDLGQTGSVPVASVLEAVRGHHILGLDTRGLSEVAVTHAARAITAKDIEARVLLALAGKYGLPDQSSLAVVFDNEVRTFVVEASATNELAVIHLTYEPRTTRFDVAFELPGSAVARRLPLHFTGSLSETFEAIVPTREIAQGQVLKSSDLAVERRPKSSSASTALTAIEQAQGLSAKHSLRAGQVIRQADVAKPELIARGESVTMLYQVPGITLTIIGKAVEPGAMGDVISVVNVQSKRTVQATVLGPGRVSVNAPSGRLAANTAP
ncbi:MAG TPA: flagellar basal body P-ring formation chaperone FlgA [Xanthobacteraceae bacterium]|jgi:flagella basal body P-ring formation protein FlgA